MGTGITWMVLEFHNLKQGSKELLINWWLRIKEGEERYLKSRL